MVFLHTFQIQNIYICEHVWEISYELIHTKVQNAFGTVSRRDANQAAFDTFRTAEDGGIDIFIIFLLIKSIRYASERIYIGHEITLIRFFSCIDVAGLLTSRINYKILIYKNMKSFADTASRLFIIILSFLFVDFTLSPYADVFSAAIAKKMNNLLSNSSGSDTELIKRVKKKIDFQCTPSLVGRGFFSSVSACFSLAGSKFSIPEMSCSFPFSCRITAEKKILD